MRRADSERKGVAALLQLAGLGEASDRPMVRGLAHFIQRLAADHSKALDEIEDGLRTCARQPAARSATALKALEAPLYCLLVPAGTQASRQAAVLLACLYAGWDYLLDEAYKRDLQRVLYPDRSMEDAFLQGLFPDREVATLHPPGATGNDEEVAAATGKLEAAMKAAGTKPRTPFPLASKLNGLAERLGGRDADVVELCHRLAWGELKFDRDQPELARLVRGVLSGAPQDTEDQTPAQPAGVPAGKGEAPAVYTLKEAVAHFDGKVSERSLRREIVAGRLRCHRARPGRTGKILIDKRDLLRWWDEAAGKRQLAPPP